MTIDATSTTQPEVAPASKSSSFPPSSYPEEGGTDDLMLGNDQFYGTSEDASASDVEVPRAEKEHTAAELVALARGNHIWLNAFACISPSPEFLQSIGAQVIACLQTSPLLDDWIGSPRNVTYIRVNRS